MKKINYILIFLTATMMQSCNWLDLAPEDQYSIDNYWASKDQVDRFIRGLHTNLRDSQSSFFKMGELRGGAFDIGQTTPFAQSKYDMNIISNNLSLENPGITNFGNLYSDILQINHAIDRIPKASFLSESEKNYDLGIVYGLRAYYYFHLFRIYGGVPKVDYPKIIDGVDSAGELNLERSTEEEIYKFIREDVHKSAAYFAEDDYTQSTDKSAYWSKAATQMLKAEVLLWGCKVKPIGGNKVYSDNVNNDLQVAKTILQEVKSKYNYLDSFADVFSTKKKDNEEMIFCIRYSLTEGGNMFYMFLYPQANGNAGGYVYKDGTPVASADFLNLANSGSAYNYQYRGDFYDSFSADDTRRDATFIDIYKGSPAGGRTVLMTKFLGEISNGFRKFTSDWPIYRYMDVILMLAETETALGNDPSSYINEVRQRAYGAKYVSHKYPQAGETAEDAILEERAKEFVAEGKRWYDIRRMKEGTLAIQLQTSVTDATTKEQHLLWPIDDGTMKKDPLLEQTKGY